MKIILKLRELVNAKQLTKLFFFFFTGNWGFCLYMICPKWITFCSALIRRHVQVCWKPVADLKNGPPEVHRLATYILKT